MFNDIKGQHLQIASAPSILVFGDKFMILTLIIKLLNSGIFYGSWLHAWLYFPFLLIVLENSTLFPFILIPTDLLQKIKTQNENNDQMLSLSLRPVKF